MYTEHGSTVDLDEIHNIVDHADVFTLAFRLFPERLLIDTRYDSGDAAAPSGTPMVAIVDPVESVQDRFFWLGQHRPGLGVPKHFMFFFWPHSIRWLEESGVWARIEKRVLASGFPGAGQTCADALADLRNRERDATVQAVRGDRFHTVWSAQEQAT